ncbi:hypothetical protein C8N46_10430 [Kordia periserrulae]|uniref:Uncharacterized protein n=1 Tax=Kordia periserrulae TaxID=701523 RepID=A0A2T6BZH0_9FLAO|nr:hypothetical protein [Kordia periserrulae]PTX61387.1 hypothetical protein C8N46_10430 [Kordia periserrulae]
MKKKNLKKLTLNKDAVSDLQQVKGGIEEPAPVPATNVASGCPDICQPLTNYNCATQNNQCASSVVAWCNLSCFIC